MVILGKSWNVPNSRLLGFCWVTPQRLRLTPCRTCAGPWTASSAAGSVAASPHHSVSGAPTPLGEFTWGLHSWTETLPVRQWTAQPVHFVGNALAVCVCVSVCAVYVGPRSGISLTLRVCSQVLFFFLLHPLNNGSWPIPEHWFFWYGVNIQIILFTLSVFALEMVHFVVSCQIHVRRMVWIFVVF